MKTILNLIITTFGVLFILSACGGGGADLTIGVEDRTCTNNPFSDDCGDSGIGTRTRIINECLEKGETCKDTTPEVETCLTDLFSAECAAVADTAFSRTNVTIAELQMTFCEANKANDNCQTTPSVMQTCTANPFDTICGATYNTNRETACRANNTSACAATITRFCETEAVGTPANLFDTLCATYDTARENACRDTPTGLDCASTITRYCETAPTTAKNFNSLCSANTVATLARDNHCKITNNAFTDNCINSGNAEGITARDNFCKDITNDYANPFTDNCINSNNAEGMTARDNFCKDITNDYANPFTEKCIDSGNAEGMSARNTFCADKALNYKNPFSANCISNNNAEVVAARNEFCENDPFNRQFCADNIKGIEGREAINGECSNGLNAFEPECNTAVVADLCIRYPFGRMQVGDPRSGDPFKQPAIDLECDPDRYAIEQAKRYNFCVNDTTRPSSSHELGCVEIADKICFLRGRSPEVENFNPFARVCQINNYGDQFSIFIACSTGNTYNRHSEACMRVNNGGSNGTEFCTKNPFSASAACRVFGEIQNTLQTAQANRLLFCRGGNANPADNLDINDPAQVALCVVDGDTSADSVLCRATGEHSNPFRELCLASGDEFTAQRLEFAGYCDTGNTNALDGAVCPSDVTTCLASPFSTDCINKAAYSDFRRSDVNDCETLGAGTSDSRCTATIKGCLANPYSEPCLSNRDYDKVRADLSSDCLENQAVPESRCSFRTAEICGTNPDVGDKTTGLNPFADTCDVTTFAEQQEGFANNCLVNSGLPHCDKLANKCINDPFNPDLSNYNCEDNVAFEKARQFYCIGNDGSTGVNVQNISKMDCKDFAEEGGNECVQDPYGNGCDTLFGSRFVGAKQNRVSYCGRASNGAGSLAIRSISDEEALCRSAFDAACTGDFAFLTTGLACFNDGAYQNARDTHLTKCQMAESARVGVECEFTAKKICQSAESIYTNPFLSVCDEGDADSLVARQGLILRCQRLSPTERGEPLNKSCDTVKANEILDNCDDRPFNLECDDYGGAGQAYATARTDRVRDCGLAVSERGNRCNGTQARLCVSNTAEAAPLSPACDNHEGIKGIRSEFLNACTNNVGVRNCAATIAGNVKTACEADPWNPAVATAGNSTVSCVDFDFYSTPRGTRKTACTTVPDTVGCEGTQAMFCTATGEPFNTILCDANNPDHVRAQRDYCQIRANVTPAVTSDCEAFLGTPTKGKPTTATLLRAQTTELRATPDETNRKNEFLKGTDATGNVNGVDIGGLVQKDGNPLTVFTLDLENDGYNNVGLDGQAADGLAFFAGRPVSASNTEPHFYGAIFAGTDLGDLLVQETGVTLNWYGRASWIVVDAGNAQPTTGYNPQVSLDFVLRVDLDAMDIDAHLSSGGVGFTIDATYDDKGVISGDVTYGVSSGTAITGTPFFNTGKIIGLIGKQGAVAVFSAYASTISTESSVGGFVAAPPRGDYLSWTRATGALAAANAGDGTARFLRGGTAALDVGASGIEYTLTLADTYSLEGVDHRIVTLGGEAADGVSFAVNELNGDRLYSGLLAGTDVGVPLTANATYQGRIGILIHKDGETKYHVSHNFNLNADFGQGTFNDGSPSLAGGVFVLSGGKFNQFGLISGTVTLGASSGTLSGLIGAEGVVGSFISTIHTDGAFAGGFVARADVTSTPPNARRTADWQAGAVRADGTTQLNVLDTTAEIEGTQGTLRAANFYKHGTSFGSATILQTETLTLGSYTDALGDFYSLGGVEADGVTFTSATVSSATRYYVGLLSGTNLGNPVSHTDARATWFGRFALIKDGLNGGDAYNADFALIVNFRDRSISSPDIGIPFALLDDGVADELNISGRYDGHGLIRGTVIYKNNGDSGAVTTTSGYLSGLIGVDGAIGAFVSDSGTGANDAYAGGFVAVPFDNRSEGLKGPVTPLRLKGFATLPNLPNQLTTTSGFLKPASGQNELDVTPSNFVTGHAIDANKIGRRGGVGSNDPDGYHYFSTAHGVNDIAYSYGGILSTTDLGAPLANSGVAAVWTGYFSHYSDITDRNAKFYIDFVAGTVGFANAAGDGVADKTFADNFGGSSDGFRLEGQFGSPHSLATGQLGGTVTRIGSSANDSYDILGLIGIEGAVAVFLDSTLHTAGGFTVSNPSRSDYCQVDVGACRVNHADWVNSFALLPPTKLDPTTQRNQFLAGGERQLNVEDAIDAQQHTISASTSLASFDGVGLGLGHNEGVSYFGDNDDQWYFYAGVLSTTDLGAPVGTTFGGETTGRWNGKFGYVAPRGGRTDFTLEIDFANSRIEAFVAGKNGNHFHVKGSYDASGAITNGTVNYGQFNPNTRTPTGNRTPNGVLTGIIGVEGAVGAFLSNVTGGTGYAGGFVAVPNAQLDADTVAVNYNDWTYSFTTRPSIYLDTTARASQFLASHSGATALDSTGAGTVNTGDRGSLNLATATFKGTAFGGQAADGISWFWDTTNTRGYAGILSGTDLGAPLVQSGAAQVKWHGHFQATGGLSRDFLLEIDFTDSMIAALVYHTGTNYYHLAGSFGANGVITGTVKYGTFTNLAMPEVDRVANGILTGLIGTQGAVASFISGTGNKNAITSTAPNYAGGFVATPTDALVANLANYDVWARGFITLPPNRVDTITRHNQFLGTIAGDTALDTTGVTVGAGNSGSLNLATATFKGTAFVGGDAADGISWFWDSANNVGYAGILSGTDLGAPLVQSGAAQMKWHGHFQANGGLSRDFLLEIDFDNNNAIAAFVYDTGMNYYHITGNFDATNGVITGEVNYGTFTDLDARTPTGNRADNGILTGLIGAQGAVGVFVGGTGTKDAITPASVNYAGGFVATPTDALGDDVANYDVWARSFATLPPIQVDPTPVPPSRISQFLGTTTGATVLDATTGTFGTIQTGRLDLDDSYRDVIFDGSADDGVSFFWHNGGQAGYAGILASTDLGAPLTRGSRDAKVTWNGQFQALIYPVNRSFALTIDFADSNAIKAFVQQAGDNYYQLKGNFDDKGVITGKVNYGTFNGADTETPTPTANRAPNGFLTGLIGEEGVVGAFLSGTGTKDTIISAAPVYYAGGFVAKSGVVSTGNNAKFSNWVDAASPLPAPTNSLGGGDFVQGTATDLPIGGRASSSIRDRGTLSLTDTLDGLAPTSGTNHGVGFFRTNNHYFAAGILSGTDLGAPLSNNAQAGEWAGRITGFSNRHSSPAINNKDFILTVTFGGVSNAQGSISAFVRDDSPFSQSNPSPFYYKIDGTYNNKGVISGTVIVAKFAGNVASGAITTPIVPNSANSLTGLIGERGAVGAFQAYYRNPSNFTAQYGFTGGFVACKRDSTGNACE